MNKTLRFNSWLDVQKNAQFKVITFKEKDGKPLMVKRLCDNYFFSLRFYTCAEGAWDISSLRITEFCDDLIHVKGSIWSNNGISSIICDINDIKMENHLVVGLSFKRC